MSIITLFVSSDDNQTEIIKNDKKGNLIPCGCGCGELIEERNKYGYKRKYKLGHHIRTVNINLRQSRSKVQSETLKDTIKRKKDSGEKWPKKQV